MKKLIEMTPEWVLDKLPHSHYADGDGILSVYTDDITDANLIELALSTLKISFEQSDYFDDDNDITFGFEFKIDDIQIDCPNLSKSIKELDKRNRNYKNSLKSKSNGNK